MLDSSFIMELNNVDSPVQQPEEEDRLSALTDDILLSIITRIDLITAARTSVLSTRWRLLPWLLPELNIDVKDFLPVPHPDPIDANDMHDAMVTLTKAVRSFFDKPRRESTLTNLQLKIYSITTFSSDIGPLVCGAIDSGLLKDLDLAILDETKPRDCDDPHMLRLANDTDHFFNAYPSVFHCLTRLSLHNVCFYKLDMHHLLFDRCTQLKYLRLFHCDAGRGFLSKIDAPNSELRVLDLDTCCFGRLELVCLPKLEKLHWDTWESEDAPLSFDSVPSLRELHLANGPELHQNVIKLSELLRGTMGIHTLTLDFMGENLWMQPEMKELSSAFSKLRMLSILGIFIEFDLIWTTALLEAAPSVEILQIQVYDHLCDIDGQVRLRSFPERRSPQWEMDCRGSKNLLLRELQIIWFKPLKQQLAFTRAMLERAPNLQKIILRDESCEACDDLGQPPPCSCAERLFPESKDEQERVVRRITDGAIFSGQVIFEDRKKL
ncbi:unnamed protein product [Triticum turgidum subsp. durum]|uniref:At1g61320/AtMIF1 LRR domain-containing protein n=1 Tax=Triticum turgidum subsp. durum TaxID=4567 RepID=A0A9R0TYJ9_TRITD|nr:unnamed protein product [Triticum turgidum subsp. durum]